jgi:YkoY family integral membrane protein
MNIVDTINNIIANATIADAVMIGNLIILESLLSVDNAAALALMVRKLPKEDKGKALKWGMWGAFVFRALCLFFAAKLMGIVGLKAIGGLYLIRLAYKSWTPEADSLEEGDDKTDKKWYKVIQRKIGPLWSTIILVELMDLSFSIDNVFAAAAMSPKYWVIMTGVIIGIITMRFVAKGFIKLMENHPSLQQSAAVVIAILGLKLVISDLAGFFEWHKVIEVLESHTVSLWFSIGMIIIFAVPLMMTKKGGMYKISYSLKTDNSYDSLREITVYGDNKKEAMRNAAIQLNDTNGIDNYNLMDIPKLVIHKKDMGQG